MPIVKANVALSKFHRFRFSRCQSFRGDTAVISIIRTIALSMSVNLYQRVIDILSFFLLLSHILGWSVTSLVLAKVVVIAARKKSFVQVLQIFRQTNCLQQLLI